MKLSFSPVKKILVALPILIVSFIFLQPKTTGEESNVPAYSDTSRDHEGDTFSIVAYDKNTGQVGGAGCSCVSYSGGIDFLSDLITDGTNNSDNIVGAIHSQAAYNASTQTIARNRMLAGDTPQEIIDATVAADGSSASRQYGVVGAKPYNAGAAGHTGTSNGNYANDIQYDDANFTISIQGNILDTSANGGRDDILNDMQDAFLNTDGTLADRLMAALQGAKRVGGDNRCQSRGNSGRTAFVQVLSPGETSPGLVYDVGDNTAAVANFIEPIDVLQCMYDSGEGNTGFFCRQTVDTFPYTMDFETQTWEKEETCNNDNSWIRTRFSTPDANTGPAGPSEGDLYTFVESSDIGSQNFNNRAVIGSPCFMIPTNSPDASIVFDYHMFGANMGTLSLMANSNDGNGWIQLWSESGNQGNQWFTNEVINISQYAGETVKFRFDATTGNGALSDMAIDNIRVLDDFSVVCSNTVSEFPYNESFEGSIGLWTQASGDDGDWLINSGTTPSGTTGPSSANNGTDYLYIEASSNGTTGEIGNNATAILESPCIAIGDLPGVFFNFDYHTFGDAIGTIAVEVSEVEGVWNNIYTTSTLSEDDWKSVSLDLSAYSGDIKLRFIGTTGTTFSSDLAIDNVSIDIPCLSTSTYNGTWNDFPDSLNNQVVINSDYTVTASNIEGCDLVIASGVTLTIPADTYVRIKGDITVNGTLLIEHQGSLVQVENDASVIKGINGVINVEIDTPILNPKDFMLLGSPMDDETRENLFESSYRIFKSRPDKFKPHPGVPSSFGINFADDNANNWAYHFNGPIIEGNAYLFRPENDPTQPAESYKITYSQGTLNNGEYSIPMTYNGATDNPDGTLNVVANPYPSAISAIEFIKQNPSVSQIYFWEHLTNANQGLPGAYNYNYSMQDISLRNQSSGSAAANDVSGSITAPGASIATGQGFMVVVTDNTPLIFNNSMRIVSDNNTLRNQESNLFDKLGLRVTDEDNNIGSNTVLAFNPDATNGYDKGFDSERIATIISLYTFDESEEKKRGYAIQTREAFKDTMEIPLGFATQVEEEVKYRISVNNIEGLSISRADLFLRDNYKNTTVNLNLQDYTFTSRRGNFNDRFTILFKKETVLETQEQTLKEVISVFPNPASDYITINTRDTAIKSIQVYDIQGRLVKNVEDISNTTEQTINLQGLKNSMYLVKINTENGTSFTKRIIKK